MVLLERIELSTSSLPMQGISANWQFCVGFCALFRQYVPIFVAFVHETVHWYMVHKKAPATVVSDEGRTTTRKDRAMDMKLKPHKLEKVNWPPDGWWDGDLFVDKETRLPTCLYPYFLGQDKETKIWSLYCDRSRQMGHLLETGFTDIFDAYHRMLIYYREWYPSRPVDRVYFIGTELAIGAKIKIGHSIYPERRLSSLQTASPVKLQIFATIEGGKDKEDYYHRRWSSRRQRGEWFTLGDCIINEINRINREQQKRPAAG
ncbi:GIY-YIG nuclease family protein [Sphingorhabdus sp. SMR4y]|uniref:GIY-YIG nuclease family protein n=1 Tax=Sphingorhabdus sp. SMR4y TaxID=2584094 RepID=UPI000B5CAF54|nr:GIY-YIG nuclease family protein [Sphingorhabdus sp. SMR4y]ASK88442.1 hypothetical protein SPHFLASMR4Y_01695 [Sphingorhabdus sp. SMR4y]